MATQTAPLMANARPRIIANSCIIIKRSLIGRGELNVTRGTEVAPHNILGKSSMSRGYSSVHLSKQLGVAPGEIQKYLQKGLGATIFKGELLATKSGLLGKKNILSPTDGVIDQIDLQSGEIRLKFLAKQVPLTAGVFGIVEQVNQEEGSIMIKTMATIVFGVLGFGYQRSGILEIVGNQTDPVRSSQITPNMSQHVLVTGALVFQEAIKKATTLEVPAVISGGFNLADYQAMVGSLDTSQQLEKDVGITVLSTEGFGPIPMGSDIFNFLRSYDGKFVFINGNKRRIILPSDSQDSILSLRKIILPQNAELTEPEITLGELTIGSKVRIIWPPLMGEQGIVRGLDATPSKLESGLSTYLVTVETGSRKIKVPFPNLELII
jgi:hypothetical protein